LYRLSGKKPYPSGRGLAGQQSILKQGLGGVVHKERPWENRIGSSRSTEYPTGAWDEGPTEVWDTVIAGHRSPGPSSGVYPEERTGKKTRKNPRLVSGSKLFSDEESDS